MAVSRKAWMYRPSSVLTVTISGILLMTSQPWKVTSTDTNGKILTQPAVLHPLPKSTVRRSFQEYALHQVAYGPSLPYSRVRRHGQSDIHLQAIRPSFIQRGLICPVRTRTATSIEDIGGRLCHSRSTPRCKSRYRYLRALSCTI